MKPVSRRQFLGTAGLAAGASVTARSVRSAPRLTLTCADYLRFTPLATSDFRPDDLDLNWVRGPRSEMLRRALEDASVDGGEASMLQHILRVDENDRSFVAVPVFPLRNFTARDLYVRKGSSLDSESLAGRRIGIYNWVASGAVWYRHFVRYLGQNPSAIRWVVGGTDAPAKVAARMPLPANVADAPDGKSLTDLLLVGEIDALWGPIPPKKHHTVEGPIVRLFPEFRTVERTYFEKTRCFPPQHVIVIRRAVWERDPSVGRRLVAALDECERKFQASQHEFPYASPWLIAEVEETDRFLGADYHAHGIEKNRHALDVFCQGAFDDGQTKRRVTVEEYFSEFLATTG
jgi:4,5-dihydroxyphthalate decarboxylase